MEIRLKLKNVLKYFFHKKKLIDLFDFASQFLYTNNTSKRRCKIEQNYEFSLWKIYIKPFFQG